MFRPAVALAAAFLVASCGGNNNVAVVQHSPSPVTGGLAGGLIAYAGAAGVGVLDPSNGKSTIIATLAPGAFRVAGPVWAPAPNVDHPVVYFTVHDDRPAERRSSAGVVPYNWLFRADPFAGTIEPVAASQDSMSEGPIGVVANSRYLALTAGCCATYEVDALDVTQAGAPFKALSRPPDQAAFFTEGIAPGASGLVAVRAFATGAWYWLNADAGVVNPFPLKLGPDDGPIAISADGKLAAVALPSHGAVIEAINSGLPLESPSAGGSAATTPSQKPSPAPTPAPPKKVNSSLLHPDGLAWSPDARQLALAVNGEIELYNAGAPDGPPATRYLGGANVTGISWSGPLPDRTFAGVKPSPGPQATVDALLAATKLPAQADTAANRPFTQVYVWEYDSSKTSPIASITDASASVLAKYPPLNAHVLYHHWSMSDTWALMGGCYRYRVVITGSIPPVATTIGLAGNAPCSAAKASPT